MNLKPKHLLLAIVATALISCIITASLVLSTTTTSTFYISGGIYPGAPAYTVWSEADGNYYAKDANGLIAFYGTNASEVVNNAVGYGGEIYFREGLYGFTTKIAITCDNTTICGENWNTILQLQYNGSLIEVSADSFTLRNIQLDGNLYSGFEGRGLTHVSYGFVLIVEDVLIRRFSLYGIFAWVDEFWLTNVRVDDSGGYLDAGTGLNSSCVFLNSCSDVWGTGLDFGGALRDAGTRGGAALEVSAGGNIFLNNLRIYNSKYGLFIYNPVAVVAVSNFQIDENQNAFYMSCTNITYGQRIRLSNGEIYNNAVIGTVGTGKHISYHSISGFNTTVSGMVTIPNGVDHIDVVHGLAATPSTVVASAISGIGVSVSIGDIGVTTFAIYRSGTTGDLIAYYIADYQP